VAIPCSFAPYSYILMTTNEVENIFRTLRSRLRGFLHVRYDGLSSEEHDDIIQDTCELLLRKPEKWNDNTRDYFPLMCEMVKMRASNRIRHYRMREGKSEAIFNKYNDTILKDPALIDIYNLGISKYSMSNTGGITERQAEIFIMSMQGYTYKEIMKKLGIAKSTVNTTISVVKKKLRSKVLSRTHPSHPIHRYRTE
jgi:RNA polymerase sigma factor (sigma-70 family)